MRVKFFEAIECQNKPEIKWMVRLKPCRILIRHVEIKCQLDATDDSYCISYCFLNMFRAPLCPSSGVREYYIEGCCLWYLVLWFSSCRYGVELRVMCPVCGLLLAARKPDSNSNTCIIHSSS